MIVLRFLLRFLVVPLGIAVAGAVAAAVVALAQWNRFLATSGAANPADDPMVVFYTAAMALVAVAAVKTMLPAAIGVLVSEAFAFRSWIFHAANGALAAWIGWTAMEEVRRSADATEPALIIVAAGIAGGFAYWAVAGWSAGFWKPVFRTYQPLEPRSAARGRTVA